jgi:hypothetical protein
MPRTIRHAIAAAVAIFASGCTETPPENPPADPRARATHADVVPISGTSPFAEGCAPEADSFGERVEDAEMETRVAVNPRDPANIAVVWMQDLFSGFVVAATRDGGVQWTIVPVPRTSGCSGGDFELAADPWLAFGPDGVLYLTGFSLDLPDRQIPAPSRTRLFAMTSRDGGFSWNDPVEVTGGYGALHDMPSLTPDPDRDCTAYAVWTDEVTAFGPASPSLGFSSTRDCGQSWSPPVAVYQPVLTPNPFTIPAGSKVLPLSDGSLLVVGTAMSSILALADPDAPEAQPDSLVAFRSTDQGTSWAGPIAVAPFPYGSFHDPETGEPVLHSPYMISAAVAPDGDVYVTYRSQLADDAGDIRVVKSTDGGRSWGEPLVVRDAATQMMAPTLAVGRDGVIGVTYYDSRNDLLADVPLTTDLWLSRSDDGGTTWHETHVAGPFDLRAAAKMTVPVEGLMVGEYMGLAAVPGGFVASFAQSGPPATAGASDVFFARVRHSALGR